MQFMVVETFRNQDAKAIYERLRERGRMMPEGLTFVSSHVAADLSQRWIVEWNDLMAFEVVPVVPGRETAAALDQQR